MDLQLIQAKMAEQLVPFGQTTQSSGSGEGIRIAAELFSPQSPDGKKLPTIIMCHGWGGESKDLRQQE
jgi:hypothetical protein